MLRREYVLEGITLAWNVVGVVVLAVAAISARSVALGASTAVIWELSGTAEDRQRLGLRIIGAAFMVLACHLAVQSTLVLVAGYHPPHSLAGIGWTAATAVVMFALAAGKDRAKPGIGEPGATKLTASSAGAQYHTVLSEFGPRWIAQTVPDISHGASSGFLQV